MNRHKHREEAEGNRRRPSGGHISCNQHRGPNVFCQRTLRPGVKWGGLHSRGGQPWGGSYKQGGWATACSLIPERRLAASPSAEPLLSPGTWTLCTWKTLGLDRPTSTSKCNLARRKTWWTATVLGSQDGKYTQECGRLADLVGRPQRTH